MTSPLQGWANVACALEDARRARKLYEECLALQRELGNASGIADCLNALG